MESNGKALKSPVELMFSEKKNGCLTASTLHVSVVRERRAASLGQRIYCIKEMRWQLDNDFC